MDDNANQDNPEAVAPAASTGVQHPSHAVASLPAPTRPQGTFPWSRLPAELRNQIYDLTLLCIDIVRLEVDEDTLGVRKATSAWWYNRRPPPRTFRVDPALHCSLSPNLLLINKQTYNEGLVILYSNKLYFESRRVLECFTHSRRLSNTQYGANLCINIRKMTDWIDAPLIEKFERIFRPRTRSQATLSRRYLSAPSAYFTSLDAAATNQPVKLEVLCRKIPTAQLTDLNWRHPVDDILRDSIKYHACAELRKWVKKRRVEVQVFFVA